MRRAAEYAQPDGAARLVRYLAGFWGLVVFMPVGLNYLAFFLLAAGLALLPQRRERLRRVVRNPLRLPLAVFVAWTLAVLATQPIHYAETPSNLWHGLRIVLTLLCAFALTREEAWWALRGFLAAAVFSLLVIGLAQVWDLPPLSIWNNLLEYRGNKSVSNALLLAVLAGSAMVVALHHAGRVRWSAIALGLAALAALLVALPNRASLLLVMCAAPAAAWHAWRSQPRRLWAAVGLALLVSAVAVAALPQVRNGLERGFAELRQASGGEASLGSWNSRAQMVRHTAQMLADRPVAGWGIGGWNDQWRKRAPPALADLNMPHNDFLWMGAQAGIPGAASWLAIMLAACWTGWRRADVTGRLAFVAALTLTCGALVNSATRDAVIGLSLVWIVGLYLRLGADDGFEFSPVLRRTAP